MQVLHPQVLTLFVMIGGCIVCLALQLGGNAVAFITLASQVVIGLTNATIVGGVFAMAAWLPQKYVQASTDSLARLRTQQPAVHAKCVHTCLHAGRHARMPGQDFCAEGCLSYSDSTFVRKPNPHCFDFAFIHFFYSERERSAAAVLELLKCAGHVARNRSVWCGRCLHLIPDPLVGTPLNGPCQNVGRDRSRGVLLLSAVVSYHFGCCGHLLHILPNAIRQTPPTT